MAITEKQRETARINGARSQGPTSAAGKERSRRNALKHGLAGDGVVLPEELAREVRDEIAVFEARHRPADAYERRLLERAALASVRSIRLQKALLTRDERRLQDAVKHWDEARDDRLVALVACLESDPEASIRLLKRFAEGCDYLADVWSELGDRLVRVGYWDRSHALRVLRLLGMPEPPNPHSPEWQVTTWKAILALQFVRDPESVRRQLSWDAGLERLQSWLPDPAVARAMLDDLIAEHHDELATLGDHLWQHHDAPDRAAARDLAFFDPSPEAARLHRYLNDAERTRRLSLAELDRGRTPAPAPGRRPAPPPDRPLFPPRPLADLLPLSDLADPILDTLAPRNEPGADRSRDFPTLLDPVPPLVVPPEIPPDPLL